MTPTLWQHQLRVEAIQSLDQPLSAPICITGKQAAPPENCGGPRAFQIQLVMPWKF
ncbi:MAG: hypothetical protein AAFX95_23665 [Cyanobacteria bacterium J06639_16]